MHLRRQTQHTRILRRQLHHLSHTLAKRLGSQGCVTQIGVKRVQHAIHGIQRQPFAFNP